MPRPALHDEDQVLDAARDLAVEYGPRAVGVRGIAQRSGAPSGSIYHRFGSRDEVLARAWLRAVERFQQGYLAALGRDDPYDAVAAAARSCARFALAEPADARLLVSHGRAALLDGEVTGPVADALATVNDPVRAAVDRLATLLYGRATKTARERVTYAVVDLPTAVLRRHLAAGTLDHRVAASLAAAARALVSA